MTQYERKKAKNGNFYYNDYSKPIGNASTTKNNSEVSLGGLKSIASAVTSSGGHKNRSRNAITLKYPEDIEDINSCPATMTFTAYKINQYEIQPESVVSYFDNKLNGSPFGDAETKQSETVTSEGNAEGEGVVAPEGTTTTRVGGSNGGNPFERERALAREQQSNVDTSSTEVGKVNPAPLKNVPVVKLYLPPSLQVNDDMNYNQADLGPGGGAALGAINSASSIVGALSKGLFEGMENTFNLVKGSLPKEAAQVMASRIAQNSPKAGLRAASAIGLQTTVNPGTRNIFEKPNTRQFTFQFKLIATSPSEAEQIRQIIKHFRTYMYPESINFRNIPIGYKFPPLFKIDFGYRGGNLKIPSIMYSYIKNANATYNATSGTFHEDGQPTEVDLTLTFLEYRALTRQDITEGGY